MHAEANEKMEVQELRKIKQNTANMKENCRQREKKKKKKLKANKPQNKSQVYKIIGYYFKLQD